MKLNKMIIGMGLMGVVLSSCSDKLDYNEYTAYDHEYIARDFGYVGNFMTKIYNNLDHDLGGGAMLSSATDESEYSKAGNSIEDFYNGSWSAANPHASIWTPAWEGITYCNEFIDNWLGLTFDDLKYNSDYAKQMARYYNYEYECRWARAYFYFTLVRQYGAIPFKIHNTSGNEETSLPRVSADVIFDFIDSECLAIQDKIVEDYTKLGDMQASSSPETGRAGKYAVMALRAQAALYHASPLFNPTNDPALWKKAALANRDLIKACEDAGKKLGVYTSLWAKDFYSNDDAYNEILFARRVANSRNFEAYNFPAGYSSAATNGANCPTQDLVDAYDEISNPSATPATPWDNLDPRFSMTIARNGEAWPTDLKNTAYTTLQIYNGGYHARPRVDYATPTGYYLKKFCNVDQILRSGYQTDSYHGWIVFRLGGMYLNYAESLFNYFKASGHADAADATDSEFTKSAREMASKTRQRTGVGMSAFPSGLSNDEFWTKYKKERQVELAFEGHRFYDVRRWKEDGDKFMKIHRMEITPVYAADGVTIQSYKYDKKEFVRGDGKWQIRWNLFPIPQSEMLKQKGGWTQNTGW